MLDFSEARNSTSVCFSDGIGEGAGYQEGARHALVTNLITGSQPMKSKLLPIGFLSLIGLAMSAGAADAGFFRHLCCNRCCTTICCRPYNAFTPFCYGGMVCDGCCPTPMCAFNNCGPIANECGAPCAHPTPPPPVGNPGYAPMPAPPTQNTTYVGQPQAVQPAGYYPGYGYYPQAYYPQAYYPQAYYPQAAYPMNYYPMYQQTPSPYYWNYGR